jgi:hypothetical protein
MRVLGLAVRDRNQNSLGLQSYQIRLHDDGLSRSFLCRPKAEKTMANHLTLAEHFSEEAFYERYRHCKDPVERTHWQIVWLKRQANKKLPPEGRGVLEPKTPPAPPHPRKAGRLSGRRAWSYAVSCFPCL